MRTRDKRRAVRLAAQMRSGVGWTDVDILTVSGRGMTLARADTAVPPTGSYLEVRRGGVAVVARIVWRSGRRFGVRSQDAIDFDGLIAAAARPAPGAETTAERSARLRAARPASADRSRMLGRIMQYAALLIAIGGGSVAIAGSVTNALAPLKQIQAMLISE